MRKNLIFIVALVSGSFLWAQDRNLGEENRGESKGPVRKFVPKEEKERPPVTDYKIITIKNDTTYVDTTLTMKKDYKFNYLRRDDFELLPINNVGQTYNSLAKREERNHILPLFGARARHFNFMEVNDIRYYHVPTPLTELYFRTTFEQGQQLDAFFTVNTSPRLNLSIAYKGVRSLGKYQHALTSTGNFRSTLSYHTKNERYRVKSHFVSQDLLNEENGGLSERGLAQYLNNTDEFRNDAEEFKDRGSIEVNFENAESILLGKRFYLDHQYAILKKGDSTTTELSVGHIMDLTDKSFQFDQAAIAPNGLFGESYVAGALSDKVALEDFSNKIFLDFKNKWLGHLRVHGGSSNYNYGYNSILSQGSGANQVNITNRIKGDVYAAGAEYQNTYKGITLFGDLETLVSGDFEGNYFNAGAGYNLNDTYEIQAKISSSSVAPNYNFLLYQSDYVSYNWQNDFKNVDTQKIKVNLKAKKIAEIEASYTILDNYSYFAKDTDVATVPLQSSESINLIKVKLSQGLKLWKIGLDNTVMYQSVEGGDQIYNVPEIITRNTLYFQDQWFKGNALFLQVGATLKYFTSYTADAYDPVLSEFYVQNDENIGGFPQVDLFFNAKIRQTRIFFKVENFGEAFSQNNEFSAPGYASRDAVIRFGFVWNFFL